MTLSSSPNERRFEELGSPPSAEAGLWPFSTAAFGKRSRSAERSEKGASISSDAGGSDWLLRPKYVVPMRRQECRLTSVPAIRGSDSWRAAKRFVPDVKGQAGLSCKLQNIQVGT